MPHKRRTRYQFNPKSAQMSRRINVANAIMSNVCVRSNNGSEMENTIHVQPGQLKIIDEQFKQFAIPQYNTTIRRHEEFIALQNIWVVPCSQLTPRSKSIIAPKVTQMMNFPQNCAVFQNLSPLNVNDTLREIERPIEASSTTKGSPSKSSLVEPQLADHIEQIEHVQLIMPEPEFPMEVEVDFPHDDFDLLRAYNRAYKYTI